MSESTTKAQANEYGVTWATSRSGRLSIALQRVDRTFPRHGAADNGVWRVWGLWVGTHDLAPVARDFRTEAEARAYCNGLWRSR